MTFSIVEVSACASCGAFMQKGERARFVEGETAHAACPPEACGECFIVPAAGGACGCA